MTGISPEPEEHTFKNADRLLKDDARILISVEQQMNMERTKINNFCLAENLKDFHAKEGTGWTCGMARVSMTLLILLLFFPIIGKGEAVEVIANVEIPERYKAVEGGETLLAETQIILVKEDRTKPTDIALEYSIKDSGGNALLQLSETKGGLLRISTIKEIRIPQGTAPGAYTLEVKAISPDASDIDTDSFEVSEPPAHFTDKAFFPFAIAVGIVFIIFFIYLFHQHKKIKRMERFLIDAKNLKGKGFIG